MAATKYGRVTLRMHAPTSSTHGLNFEGAWPKVPGHAHVGIIDNGIQEDDLQQNLKKHFAGNWINLLYGNNVDEVLVVLLS